MIPAQPGDLRRVDHAVRRWRPSTAPSGASPARRPRRAWAGTGRARARAHASPPARPARRAATPARSPSMIEGRNATVRRDPDGGHVALGLALDPVVEHPRPGVGAHGGHVQEATRRRPRSPRRPARRPRRGRPPERLLAAGLLDRGARGRRRRRRRAAGRGDPGSPGRRCSSLAWRTSTSRRPTLTTRSQVSSASSWRSRWPPTSPVAPARRAVRTVAQTGWPRCVQLRWPS